MCFIPRIHDKNAPWSCSSTQWMKKTLLRGKCAQLTGWGGIVEPQAEVYVRESKTIDRLTVHITPVGVSAVWVETRSSVMLSIAGSDGSEGMLTYCMSWMRHHTHDGVSSSGVITSCLWCEVKLQQTHNSNSESPPLPHTWHPRPLAPQHLRQPLISHIQRQLYRRQQDHGLARACGLSNLHWGG